MNIFNFSLSSMIGIIVFSIFIAVISAPSVYSSIEVENTLKDPIEVKKDSASQGSTEPVLIHIKEQEQENFPPACKQCHQIIPRGPIPQDKAHKAFIN